MRVKEKEENLMDRDELLIMSGVCVGIFIFFFALITGLRKIEMIQDNVPVVVLVDKKEVYAGPSYGVNIISGGQTTQIIIKGGFMYWSNRKVYVSKDVVVSGSK